ncbi:putative pumilio-like protein 7, chloroplastic [Iris pallida]|uniref:Pumilio-like protein 7, chloroplastic n=1 Tax=Iris pallida TaxID=29817 RepID=A0AAX6FRG4_IRIPA|nr:putative pumilio-like protein 7, chloroplastic [Iris pallida]
MYNSPRIFPAPFPMKFAGMELLRDEIPVAATSPHPSPHHHYHHQHRHGRYQPDIDGYDYRRVSLLQPSDRQHHRYSNSHLYDPSAIGSDPSSGSGSLSPDSPIRTAALLLNYDELDLIKRLRSIRVDEAGLRARQQRVHYGHGHGHGHNRVPSYPDPEAAALQQLLYSNQVPGLYPNPDAAPVLSHLQFGSRPAAVADDTVILHGRQYRSAQYAGPAPVTPPPAAAAAARRERYMYLLAKDQNGCRFLQRKLVEGTRKEKEAIFFGIIDHVGELMANPFANYLVQKVLEVCTEEQRLRVVLELVRNRMELVGICLNNHGTRAVQRLIETLKTRQQIGLVVAALKPGFLDLTKDLNGNHVIQRCLLCLPNEDNKFIFDAAAKHCVEIATHQHGCCVMQRCIGSSTGEHRARLVGEISANGLHLAQDPFGNYVVQYTLDLKHPTATANFVSQFQGNYVNLSLQKFSSNVVEKCLKVFGDNHQANIVVELLSVPRLDQLLQDPYANYVIQCALATTKGGTLHSALLKAIKPHASVLLTSPYSKKIYNMLK